MYCPSIFKALAVITLACFAVSANATLLQDTVSSRDNLFYTDWNGFFNPADLPDYEAPGSVAAQSLPFDFVLNNVDSFVMTVTGEVVDSGPYATGPDGCPNPADPCFFDPSGNNGIYNFLPAYSVIGVWSTTPDIINFITPAGGTSWIDALVEVGSGGLFHVPQGYSSAYLFLAENDGFFTDNDPIGEYEVTISLVPVPATVWLFGVAVLGLGLIRAKR